jgi:hypothetical protein
MWPYADSDVRLARGPRAELEASINKLSWSEYFKRTGELTVGIDGTSALVRLSGDG